MIYVGLILAMVGGLASCYLIAGGVVNHRLAWVIEGVVLLFVCMFTLSMIAAQVVAQVFGK